MNYIKEKRSRFSSPGVEDMRVRVNGNPDLTHFDAERFARA